MPISPFLLKSALAGAMLVASLQTAAAFDSGWHWIRVTPRDNAMPVSWEVEQGMAKNVVITGKSFTADLYPDDVPNPEAAIRLHGTIAGDRITASAIYVGTDADPEPYRGTLTVRGQTRHITLKGTWADAFIGLTRLQSSPPRP